MVLDLITFSPLFAVVTLICTYLISEAYKKTKIGLKHKSVAHLIQPLSSWFKPRVIFSCSLTPPLSLSLSLSLCCQDLSEAGGSRVERGSDGYLHFREEIEQS